MTMKYIIGVDEVGRGALAGPVVVAAVAIPRRLNIKYQISNTKLRDSKQLTARQREVWADHIKENFVYSVARVYPRGVDALNIAGATNLAAYRAIQKITSVP